MPLKVCVVQGTTRPVPMTQFVVGLIAVCRLLVWIQNGFRLRRCSSDSAILAVSTCIYNFVTFYVLFLSAP